MAESQNENPRAVTPATTAAAVVQPSAVFSCVPALKAWPLLRIRCTDWSKKIDREKERFKTEEDPEGATAFRRVEELRGPAELSQGRPDGREQNQIMPVFAQGDRRQPQIEQRNVKKERGRVVRSAPQQDGSEKTA